MSDVGLRAFLTTERIELRVSEHQPLVVRRGAAHELWLADPAISRDSEGVVGFVLRGDQVILEPRDPQCVVLVNGDRIREAQPIHIGDRIRIGYTILVVQEIAFPEGEESSEIRTISLRTAAAQDRRTLSAEADRLAQWAESFEAVRSAADDHALAEILVPHLARLGEADHVVLCQSVSDAGQAAYRELASRGFHSGEIEEVLRWCSRQAPVEGPSAPLIREVTGRAASQRAAVGCVVADGLRWVFYLEPPALTSAQAVAHRGLSLLSNLLLLYQTLHGGASQKQLISELTKTVRTYSQPLDEAIYQRVKERFVFRSSKMQMVCRQLARAAAAGSPVVILGERGTGKQVAADAIHGASARRQKPMVSVSLAESNEELIEGDLFGTVKGAFNGAVNKKGLLEAAHDTTMFLDEIGEVSLATQAKLLRVLERGEFRRVGDANLTRVNVRLIFATNRDLADEVRRGNFRADLFDRINVIPIRLPPLRDRLEDIPLLAAEFLKHSNERNQRQIRLTDESLQHLARYTWPENVRGLQNYLERAVVMAERFNAVLSPDDLPPLGTGENLSQPEHGEILVLVDELQRAGKPNQARILKLMHSTPERLPKTEFA